MSSTSNGTREEVLDGVALEDTTVREDGVAVVMEEVSEGVVTLEKAEKVSVREEMGGEDLIHEADEEYIRHVEEDHGGEPISDEPITRGTVIITLYDNMPAKVVFKGKTRPLGAREINDAKKWLDREYRRQRTLWSSGKDSPNVS